MSFAGEQTRGRVEPHPAGARQIHLAPCMQVGEVHLRAGGPLERLDVRFELNQVARNEARGKSEVAQQLHQQPARVAARAAAERERLLRRLDARLETDHVAHVLLQPLIQLDEELVRRLWLARHLGEVGLEERRRRQLHEVGREFVQLPVLVFEREFLCVGLEEEIERIDDRHLRDQINLELQFPGALGEDDPGQPVRLRVLLPVDEVVGGGDAQRVREDRRARVRCRTQAHQLRAERDRPVVAVVRDVIERDVDAHCSPARTWACATRVSVPPPVRTPRIGQASR